jgi:ubiquinone/menaquinone biosynthesis C-methylase UbiE
MAEQRSDDGALAAEIAGYDARGLEGRRLGEPSGELERARTQEILLRHLRPAPAAVLDVGGGPGAHACWLAQQGSEVHLLDPVSLHVEQARQASAWQPARPLASVALGDARGLGWAPATADAVLLVGPLYHLTDRADRLRALREARRVLRAHGVVVAAAISQLASALDGLRRGFIADPAFAAIVEQDLRDGQHRNPSGDPAWFTTARFHRPTELQQELDAAGFEPVALLAVEGPAWMLQDLPRQWSDPARRAALLQLLTALEREPAMLGVSAHRLVVGRRSRA